MSVDVSIGRTIALLIVSVMSGVSSAQSLEHEPPPGHTRSLMAQRTATPPLIDGNSNDWQWHAAVVAESFWASDLQQPPSEQTRVLVLYDDRALYFAFTCLDAEPDQIRANQLVRDAAPGFDDRVTVELDPFHNHRSISRFTVTARGTQSDVMAAGRADKREWKGEWTAAAQRTARGWTAEIAIPFDLLEFDPRTTTFGVNFSRYQNRTREWSEWANLTPRRLTSEMGHLAGLDLSDAPAVRQLAVMPYVTSLLTRDGRSSGGEAIAGGLDMRYRWQAVTSVVSVMPDFSGVEREIADLGFSYTEKFVRDERPFFQEGRQFFANPEAFHSGRIDEFDVGAKAFGRVDGYQVGVLVTADGDRERADYVGHVTREVGSAFDVSATLAGRQAAHHQGNTLHVGADGHVAPNVQVKASVARSSTADARQGVRGQGELKYATAHWYSAGWVDHTDGDYTPTNGFLAADVIGTSGRGAYAGYTGAFTGTWLRRADVSLAYDERHTSDGLPQRQTGSVYVTTETAANLQLNVGVSGGTYRPRTSSHGGWAGALNQDRFHLASAFYASPAGRFGYGAQYTWGTAGTLEYDNLAPSLWIAPNPHLSMAYSFERATDDQVRHQHVVSGVWAISGGQSIAGRWVESEGSYYRLTYRRLLANGIDAVGVYNADSSRAGELTMKLVWSWHR